MYLRPLFILLALYVAKKFADSGESILGSRTVQAKDFQDTVTPVAVAVENETGISGRLGIIQASLESKNGGSDLSSKDAQLAILPGTAIGPALNIFGFKTGDAWMKGKQPYVLMPTTDYYMTGNKMPNGLLAPSDNFALKWPAPFRAYPSWEASYRDWARLMQTPGYVADGALDALKQDDLEAFGIAMSKRFAPNQNYGARIASRASSMGLV